MKFLKMMKKFLSVEEEDSANKVNPLQAICDCQAELLADREV